MSNYRIPSLAYLSYCKTTYDSISNCNEDVINTIDRTIDEHEKCKSVHKSILHMKQHVRLEINKEHTVPHIGYHASGKPYTWYERCNGNAYPS